MNIPATAWVAVSPALVAALRRSPLEVTVSLSWSTYSVNWVSLIRNVVRSQSRTWVIPPPTCCAMSAKPPVNWEATRVSRPPMTMTVARTVRPAAAPLGTIDRSRRCTGASSAASRVAATMGMTTSDRWLRAKKRSPTAVAMSSRRHAHSLAARTAGGTGDDWDMTTPYAGGLTAASARVPMGRGFGYAWAGC